jgi:ATP-binding protein involved in chromosome partitioning
LAQQAQLSGAVIVTTPQDVAVDIARKGLMMFEQVNVPILGIVENMSGFICSHCHHETHIFPKKESVEHLAASHKTSVLGRIPLDPLCSYSSDEGLPLLIQHPNSIPAQAFKDTAVHLISTLLTQQEQLLKNKPQHVSLDESTGSLLIQWDEQHQGKWSAHSLRIQCPCAVCVDEHSGRRLLDPKTIPLDIRITNQSPIGQYGLSLRFSDKHSTGIYKWTMLKSCCECATCQASSASSSSQTFTV